MSGAGKKPTVVKLADGSIKIYLKKTTKPTAKQSKTAGGFDEQQLLDDECELHFPDDSSTFG